MGFRDVSIRTNPATVQGGLSFSIPDRLSAARTETRFGSGASAFTSGCKKFRRRLALKLVPLLSDGRDWLVSIGTLFLRTFPRLIAGEWGSISLSGTRRPTQSSRYYQ